MADEPDYALEALKELSGNTNYSYPTVDQPNYDIAQTEVNVTTPTPGSWSWDTSMWNPSNWFRGNAPQYANAMEYGRSMGLDVDNMDAFERMQLEGLYQGQQRNSLAQQALGWGKIGSMAQLGGAIIKPFFDYKNYQLAKDSLNFMKDQANKNWLATARNYNDRARMLNWGGSSFNGGGYRPWYHTIPEK